MSIGKLGVKINNMRMPESCWHCQFAKRSIDNIHYCYLTLSNVEDEVQEGSRRKYNCPIEELP